MTRRSRRAPRLLALAVVLVLSLLLAGCGGDDDLAQNNSYVEQVNVVQTQFANAYQRVASQITSTTSGRADGKTFEKLAGSIDLSVTELRKVQAPGKVDKLHTQLIDVLDGYGDKIAAASEDLAAGDDPRAARAMTSLQKATASASIAFSRKVDEINAALRE